MTILSDMISAVFRPSVAALAISCAVAIVSYDSSPSRVSQRTIDITNLGCAGLLSPVCKAFTF